MPTIYTTATNKKYLVERLHGKDVLLRVGENAPQDGDNQVVGYFAPPVITEFIGEINLRRLQGNQTSVRALAKSILANDLPNLYPQLSRDEAGGKWVFTSRDNKGRPALRETSLITMVTSAETGN